MKFLFKNITLFFFLFTGMNNAFAQKHIVEGNILDKNSNLPVANVLIYLPDLNKSIYADDNGHFIITNLPGDGQKFTFIHVGYRPASKTIFFTDSITHITISLEPGNREMEEVIVMGTQSHTEDQSSSSIASLSQRVLRSHGALSISDGVTKLPGINQLSTGAGISKPVIRGMYGNRIQTVVMGMRFDNQQWQDEHGLGLQDIGVDRVEVIKGPAALMYGSEAMGGVINIIEEKPAFSDSIQSDISSRIFSNTFGAGIDGGVRKSAENHSWRIRLGAESHADYSDGNNSRVFNSRFDGYVGKANYTFNKKNWVSNNNYFFSKSDFGFIMDTAISLVHDGRASRDFSNPHHIVFINLFTSQNTFFGKDGNIFRIIFGTHINRRREDEGGGGISLDMQLLTFALHFQYEHPINENWTWINGLQTQFQNNKNLGFRIIVPDADLAESSLYSFAKKISPLHIFEFGIRYDARYIKTFPFLNNATLAAPPPVLVPVLNKIYNAVNGSAGASFEIFKDFHLKANITSGYRTPNLAELQSNGVHEGTFRYEIGDANMKIEQNFCAEAGFTFQRKHFEFTATVFDNRFLHYVYLQPSDQEYFGFKIYNYLQTNATLQGGEATLDFSPEKAEWLDISTGFSTVRAKTDNGNYLPFIPADRLDGNVKIETGDFGKWMDNYFRIGTQYFFPQIHPAQFESTTPDYALIDAGAGTTLHFKNNTVMNIDLCCNNLLNKVYYDHLSRFKEFGIYNIGRNICVNMKYEW
ncbi:TonB-dependent receptor [soil metagenome]